MIVDRFASSTSTRFLAWKKEKGQETVKDARGRFNKWIAPHIGPTPIRAVTRVDLVATTQGYIARAQRVGHRVATSTVLRFESPTRALGIRALRVGRIQSGLPLEPRTQSIALRPQGVAEQE